MDKRTIEIARAAWGVGLLTAPGLILRRIPRSRNDRTALIVARVLGARQITQAVLSGLSPSPEVLAMGVWVDAAHAATAVGLGIVDRRRASAGFADAAIAAVWATIGWRDLARGRATPPDHERQRDALARRVLELVPGGAPLLARARAVRSAAAS